jgi:hypothetical protein
MLTVLGGTPASDGVAYQRALVLTRDFKKYSSKFQRLNEIIIIHSQIPFPANSNQYRCNNEFLINQKL